MPAAEGQSSNAGMHTFAATRGCAKTVQRGNGKDAIQTGQNTCNPEAWGLVTWVLSVKQTTSQNVWLRIDSVIN